MNNEAMYRLSYGLYVLTAEEDGFYNGCIINTAIQAASAPNQISVCVNKANYTHDMLKRTNKLTVSVISEKADFELFKHFGFNSGKSFDKFKEFTEYKLPENGVPYITVGTNAYISATIEKTVDLGSHTMFIGKAVDMEVLNEDSSATYGYYLENIKPKAEVKKSADGKTVWRCNICGYEYEGEELPADYVCPLCKHPASDFTKVTV